VVGVSGVDLTASGVDVARIEQWMLREGICSEPLTSVQPISGGSQNVLVVIESDGREMVLRRPPVHKRDNSDETMRREAYVLRALADTTVPHPRLIASCSDLSVTGAAFYLMERVRGTDVDTAIKSAVDPVGAAHAIGLSVADAAAELAAVAWPESVLDGLGRTDGWLDRQVGRWRRQLDSYDKIPGYEGPGELGSVDEIGQWLEQHRPTGYTPGLIHGDFHLGNLIYTSEPPEVCAIVDWELAAVGDPLLDLAHMLATWPDGRLAPAVRAEISDLPTDAEMVARYVGRSGRDIAHLPWYRVLACYRLGILLEGSKARADAGRAPAETGRRLHEVAIHLFDQARDLVRGGR
jgi:aminoglycoside phosphotransferase (APT) family kinase protein